jgi:hypothetical protein
LLTKTGTGAAINAGQDLAVRTTISGISDTQASKEQFGPSWETTALAAVPGAAFGSMSKGKTEVSTTTRETQSSPSIDTELSSNKTVEKPTLNETTGRNVNSNMPLANVEAVQKSEGVSAARTTVATPEMESKILFGERVINANGTPSNRLVGAHGGEISDAHPNYAVDVSSVNSDGTRNAKLVTQFPDVY